MLIENHDTIRDTLRKISVERYGFHVADEQPDEAGMFMNG